MNASASTLHSDVSEPGSLHVPTDETRAQVKALISFGHSDEEIAGFLRIKTGKLRAMYRDELHTGLVEANMSVAASLRKVAEGGNVLAQMFWLKNRDPSRWKDKVAVEHSGNGNSGPVVNIHLTQAAPKALEHLPQVIEGTAVTIKTKEKVRRVGKDG